MLFAVIFFVMFPFVALAIVLTVNTVVDDYLGVDDVSSHSTEPETDSDDDLSL